MCQYYKNYYIYASCMDPGAHFFKTSTDGHKGNTCSQAPHERFIVVQGSCPIC